MKILTLEENNRPHSVEIKAVMGDTEFQQLLGRLDNLAVFATETINAPAAAIKTGARHSYAKYLLFPVKLRREFRTDGYDFDKLDCGVVRYRDKLYVIYGVDVKQTVKESKPEDGTASETPGPA